jgi:molybdopterin synthase sulfur carrier subunit
MSRIKISLFGSLARFVGEKTIYVDALTLEDAINEVSTKYWKEFRSRILDENGKIKRFVNVYVNGKDIRFLSNLKTALSDGDEVSFIPAVGGG